MRRPYRLTVALLGAALLASAPAGAAAWSPVQRLSDIAGEFDLGTDAAGDAVVAWDELERGGGQSVWVSERSAGKRFGPPQRLTAPGGTAGAPRVAMNARGDAIVVWLESPDAPNTQSWSRMVVRSAYKPAGGAFARAEDVGGSANVAYPLVAEAALEADGTAVVAWPGLPATWAFDGDVRVSFRPPGTGTWSAVRDLGAYGNPALALAAAGDHAVLVWQYDSGPPAYRHPLLAADAFGVGPFRAPVTLAREGGIDPTVTVDDGGNATAAWWLYGRDGKRAIVMDSSPRARAWRTPSVIGHGSFSDLGGPHLSSGPAGDLTVSWIRVLKQRTLVELLQQRAGRRSRVLTAAARRTGTRWDGAIADPHAVWTSDGRLIVAALARSKGGDWPVARIAAARPLSLSSPFSEPSEDWVWPKLALVADRRGGAILAWQLAGALEVAYR